MIKSSRATVVTALTSLYAAMIRFVQVASLIVGMNSGSVVMATLAARKLSFEVLRTGLSQMMDYWITRLGMLILITLYIQILEGMEGVGRLAQMNISK